MTSMSHPESITVKEVCDLAEDWFHGVASGEAVSSIARLFRYPDTRIHTPDGQAFSLEDHRLLHTKWTAEKHRLGDFRLTSISDEPPRVRAVGTVYWEARYSEAPSSGPSLIKAVVGEDWIIERRPDGRLCFALYGNSFFHLLPESAQVQL
jgi:hypothetical protein